MITIITYLLLNNAHALSIKEINSIPLYACAKVNNVVIKKHETGFISVENVDYFSTMMIVKHASSYKIVKCPRKFNHD
jgi:hypothetical protein